ncbi:MAG: DNA polymerase III subunit delta' [Alphaproteobacteria bacterium]|nr:DNA polymerase III subunit delta' [Alphaproteobacteria bacterium]
MSDDDFNAPEDEAADDGTAILPSPRENGELVGHAAAEAAFLGAYNAKRLPHAWLLAGPAGIGKATFAYCAARFLLAQPEASGGLFGDAAPPTALAIPPEHPVFRLVASGAHPDLLVVERAWDEKRKRLRSEIVVDDARAIAAFLHLTPSQGAWRVVIVDGADEMNRNAANALLKVLEEPPKRAVLFLTSESPGRLLPTIRSRCRMLHMNTLPQESVLTAIQRFMPELDGDDAAALAQLAGGSIGRALTLGAQDGLVVQRGLFGLLGGLPKLPGESLHAFAETLVRGEAAGFGLLTDLLPRAVAATAMLALGREPAASPAERAILARLAARRSAAQWAELWRRLGQLFGAAEGVELDKRAVVLDAFFALADAAR